MIVGKIVGSRVGDIDSLARATDLHDAGGANDNAVTLMHRINRRVSAADESGGIKVAITDRLRIDAGSLEDMLRGSGDNLRLSDLEAIADILGCNVSQLLSGA